MTEDAGVAGAVLRTVRRRAGLTQRQLGERAGVTQPVIAAYESGRRQPSVPALLRLVRAAGHRLDLGLRPRRTLPDDVHAGRELARVLELADHLPRSHRRTLSFPRLPEPAP